MCHRYSIEGQTFVDMGYNPTSRILLLAAMPASSSTDSAPASPRIEAYQVEAGRLHVVGSMAIPQASNAVSKLRYLAKGSDIFITGHSLKLNVPGVGDTYKYARKLQALQRKEIIAIPFNTAGYGNASTSAEAI